MKTECIGHRRGGRPRKDPTTERVGFNHGWLVGVDAHSSKILSMAPMAKPENNKDVLRLLGNIVKRFPKIKTMIYDRACSFQSMAKKQPSVKPIKHYIVDKFHAFKHSRRCPCSPAIHKKLARVVKDVNTSAAEQTFAWLRKYAFSLNNMDAQSHEFMLLAFCRMHNRLVDSEWAPSVLKANRRKKKYTKAYGC